MTASQVNSLFTIVFLLGALVCLYTAVRGLLGFDLVLPTKFSGLKRFKKSSARAAGAVMLFFGLLLLCVSYATTKQ
jgi:hypothetical protein